MVLGRGAPSSPLAPSQGLPEGRRPLTSSTPALGLTFFLLQVEMGTPHPPCAPHPPFQAETCQARGKAFRKRGAVLAPQSLSPEKVATRQRESFRGAWRKERPLWMGKPVNASYGGKDSL